LSDNEPQYIRKKILIIIISELEVVSCFLFYIKCSLVIDVEYVFSSENLIIGTVNMK